MQKGVNALEALVDTALSSWWQLVGKGGTSGTTQGMSHHVNKLKNTKTLCCSNIWHVTKDVRQVANKAL